MKPTKPIVFFLTFFIQVFSIVECFAQKTALSNDSTIEITRSAPGLPSMRQIEALPLLFPNGTVTKQFSSYDPTGGNGDGNFKSSYTKYIDDNGEFVIFDASGPGCLYRQQYNVWSKGRVPEAIPESNTISMTNPLPE